MEGLFLEFMCSNRRLLKAFAVSLNIGILEGRMGPLQTCTGLRSGIEASIHFSKRVWDEDETEAIIQVDADNAFNRLNRQVALHNIRELCPSFHRYLYNHYQMPAQLIINDHVKLEKISSEEGPTQGDVAAMANYALGITPLVNDLANKIAALILKG